MGKEKKFYWLVSQGIKEHKEGIHYYNELLKTRSTRIAQEKSNESFIVITPKSTQPITMIYNVHDGGAEMIIRKTGNNYEFWSATENKKYHDIHIISENKLKIGNISFVKLSNNTEFSNESVQKLIGGILFKGTYTTENNKTITFDADGKITGLSDFQYYAPLIDYFDGGMDIDIVYLGKSTENVQGYAFAFNTDTLFLYDFKCVEILDKLGCCDSITSGELKYKLIKQ